MRAGCATAEQVCERTGAASHCGSCAQLVTEVTGDPGGRPVRAFVAELHPRLARVTLRPEVGASFDSTLRPGQHVVLSVWTEDGWVVRTYTVASAAEDVRVRELLVRLRPDGRMARVLARAAAHRYIAAQLSDPRGEAFSGLRRNAPTVFIVAGVGVTPALSALRSLDGPAVRMVVAFLNDRDEELALALRAACAAKGVELEIGPSDAMTGQTATGTATALASDVEGLSHRLDIAALASAHADADWFVCGRPEFERKARAQLRAGGVPERHVHVERFLVSANASTTPSVRARSAAEARWARTGLGLALLWLIWLALPGVDSWRALQSSDTWRTVTGSVLIATLSWLWIFPVLRIRGCFAAARRLELGHRVVGALSPLVLMLHQRSLGYGLLSALGVLWVLNTALGCCDKTMIDEIDRRARYAKLWLPVHVTVSMVVTALSVWHVVMILLFRGGTA